MELKTILRWIAKLLLCIAMGFVFSILSDKYGYSRVTLNALAVALLLFLIGKTLTKRG